MSLMKKLNLILNSTLIYLFLFSFYNSNATDKINGLAKVIDGDTICFDKISKEKIFCGELSKQFLKKKIQNKKLSCIPEKKLDQYNRVVAECFIKDKSLSAYMVRSGYAFDYKKYSKGKYKNEQEQAKKENIGLWKTNFDYPWIWRKNNK